MDQAVKLRVRELKPGFGAEVQGVDLSTADSSTIRDVVNVFDRHGVLLVRDQALTPDDLMRFLGHFGAITRGVIDLRDVFHFLSIMIAFLGANAILVDLEKAE